MRQLIERDGRKYLICTGYAEIQPHEAPIEEFYKDARKSLGLTYRCKKCVAAKARDYWKNGMSGLPHENCPTCGSRVPMKKILMNRTA